MRFLRLGASLYVPATRDDLAAVGGGLKYPHLRSVIFCTEDAIRPPELPAALARLAAALPALGPAGPRRFVRVRGPGVLRTVLGMAGVERLDGFVLPKVTPANLGDYLAELGRSDFLIMPTLETAEAFDPAALRELRAKLLEPDCRRRVLTLRVGGCDLLGLLGLRRPAGSTLYATPLAATVAQFVTTFRPHGFNLTGAVFDHLDRPDVLAREVRQDLAHGLFGKSAVHPDQVAVIEAAYRVRPTELRLAERVLDPDAPAVFRSGGEMAEPATQRLWAEIIRERAQIYGVIGRAAPVPGG
jgi:citrate lyase beta subunit